MHHLSINAVRSEALFVSALQRSDDPSAGQVSRPSPESCGSSAADDALRG